MQLCRGNLQFRSRAVWDCGVTARAGGQCLLAILLAFNSNQAINHPIHQPTKPPTSQVTPLTTREYPYPQRSSYCSRPTSFVAAFHASYSRLHVMKRFYARCQHKLVCGPRNLLEGNILELLVQTAPVVGNGLT